jgi:hypothetical protein
MQRLELALAALEAKIADAQGAADALGKALKRLAVAAETGHIADLEKGLPAIAERGREAEAAARSLSGAWDFDVREYLSTNYSEELREEAAKQGINLFVRDGRLYAFPLLLKIEARDASVRIGKKLERRIRPNQMGKFLLAVQKRPQRFREDKFLALVYEVYGQIGDSEWRKAERARGPAISLARIHDLLTLLPGADYPIEEFGRDLLLLDRQPDLKTRDGCSFEFPRDTLARGAMKQVTVYDEQGLERTYIAIRFVGER